MSAATSGEAGLVSIIVSTYNRPAALDRVLLACTRQDDARYEVIVADDGSKQPTRELVERHRARSRVPLIHVWHPDDGFRLAEIRNKAVNAAHGDYLVFLDGDCIPQRSFVTMHRALARPGAMVTGSRILLSQRLTQRVESQPLDLWNWSGADWIAARMRGDVNKCLPLLLSAADLPGRAVDGFKWRSIKGCNLAAWAADVARIDGFDSGFTSWGHEDADFVARLHHAGVGRRKGFFATEVLHLWHREAARDGESGNYREVLRRLETRQVLPARGLAASREDAATVVTR